jgi:hypothetical protein
MRRILQSDIVGQRTRVEAVHLVRGGVIRRMAIVILACSVVLPDVSSGQVRAQAGAQAIASVIDVAADAAGRIYVADDRSGKIHIFDSDLRSVTSVGRPGNGEGEFQTLRGVRAVDDSSFAGIDRYMRRIYVWVWRGASPQLKRTIAVPFEPHDFCLLSNRRVLVVGWHAHHRVHELDDGGRVVRSLARLDSTLTPAMEERVSRGNIACTNDGAAVLTSTGVPLVEVLQTSGTTSSERVFLAPIRPMGMEATPGGGARFTTPNTGFHAPYRGFVLGNAWVVGARIVGRRDNVAGDSVRLFSIDRRRSALIGTLDYEGRLFPVGGDRALRVIDRDGEIALSIVSLQRLGLASGSTGRH